MSVNPGAKVFAPTSNGPRAGVVVRLAKPKDPVILLVRLDDDPPGEPLRSYREHELTIRLNRS
jgi:hypothetical protein